MLDLVGTQIVGFLTHRLNLQTVVKLVGQVIPSHSSQEYFSHVRTDLREHYGGHNLMEVCRFLKQHTCTTLHSVTTVKPVFIATYNKQTTCLKQAKLRVKKTDMLKFTCI